MYLSNSYCFFCRSLEELYLDMFVGDSADDQVSMDDFSFGIEKLQLQVSAESPMSPVTVN